MMQYPQPEAVFRYFDAIAAIPHGSGQTGAIRQWALDTARGLGLDALADETGNVVIRKPASAGLEARPRVILQGHLDMVLAKLPDCRKNLECEGLDLIWGEEYLSADGTTLGGDDGIAIAYAFAVLESDSIPHPPLTVILTVDEETGMDGATALSPDALDGQYLINIDSEEEGIFTVGCAGGVRTHLLIPAKSVPCSGACRCITVSGLTGGHSGADIHKPLLNANTVMLRLLRALPVPVQLAAWQGGDRDNVIPSSCTAMFYSATCAAEEMDVALAAETERICAEYPQETDFSLTADVPVKSEGRAVSAEETAMLLDTLAKLPNGVQAVCEGSGLPQTSLNLGIFRLQPDGMYVDALIRSEKNAEKYALAEALCRIAEDAGGSSTKSGDYPAWEYAGTTALETQAAAVYREICGTDPQIVTIHAGLECGILAAKAPQLQCISIGPDILDIHTPRERLSIPSVQRTWEFLCALLRTLS